MRRASINNDGNKKHIAVQRCTNAAVGPPCFHKLPANPYKNNNYYN